MVFFWRNRKYHLDQMMFGELIPMYVQHPTVLTYAALLAASATLATWLSDGPPRARALQIGAPAMVAVLIYPLAEYLLHRVPRHSRQHVRRVGIVPQTPYARPRARAERDPPLHRGAAEAG